MADATCLFLSLMCLLAAIMLMLFPVSVKQASRALDRTLAVVDDQLVKHRYVFGLVLFLVSYSLFRLALLIPNVQ